MDVIEGVAFAAGCIGLFIVVLMGMALCAAILNSAGAVIYQLCGGVVK